MESFQGTLRKAINQQAELLGCASLVENLPDGEAIRFIQGREGFTQCFGLDKPLEADSNGECKQYHSCLWFDSCRLYRSSRGVQMIEKAFPGRDREFFIQVANCLDRLAAHNLDELKRFVGTRLSSLAQIESISKKLVITSPNTVLIENEKTACQKWITRSAPPRPYTGSIQVEHTILYTSDIAALINWLENARGFLNDGTILYAPFLKKKRTYSTKYDQMAGRTPFYLKDAGGFPNFSTPHLALSDESIKINRSEFRPLFHIDLPFIRNVDLKLLNEIMTDNPETLGAFRDFFINQLDSAQDAALGSEQFSKDCRRIERNIRAELRKLNTSITTNRIKNLTALVGGTIATWTLALFCIVQGQHDMLKIIGPGGAVWSLSTAYMEYLTGKISLRDNPVYFLWILGQSKK
jgi:hypothetical protein